MSLFPIVQRELNLASRRAGTYWLRFWTAALVSGISVTLALGNQQSPSKLGQNLFAVLSILAFAYSFLAGVRYTADALSEERREGTLGLLFLTDLRGFDVVVGKLAVTSLHAFFGLLAIFPMLGLPLLLGGVTGIEFWRVTLVLLNTLIFSLSIGLLVSTFGTNERGVMLKTLFLLLLFAGGLPIVWKGATRWADIRLFDLILLLPSPLYTFKMSAAGIFGTGSSDFWPSMLAVLAISALCVSTASIQLPRIFQEKGRASRHRSGSFRYRLRFGSPGARQRLRTRLLNRNPFAWLVSRDRSLMIGLLVLVVVTAVFGFWAAQVIQLKLRQFMAIAMFGTFGFHLLLKFLVTAEACRRLNEDKRSGALELLLCSPLKVKSLIRGQSAKIFRLFLIPLAAVAILNLILAPEFGSDDSAFVYRGILILLLDCLALTWVGMWNGLQGQPFARAVLGTLARVMIPPWIILFVFFATAIGRSMPGSTVRDFFVFWFVVVLVYDLWLAARFRRRLAKEFRTAAANVPGMKGKKSTATEFVPLPELASTPQPG